MNRAMNRRRQSAGITQVRSAGWGLMSSAQHASGHGQNAKTGYGRKRFARRRQDIVIGLLFIGGVIAALAIVAEFGVPSAPRPISSAVLNTADIEDPLIGTLTVQTDENKCELTKFDNETGRTIQNTARAQRCHYGRPWCTGASGHRSPPRRDQQILLSRRAPSHGAFPDSFEATFDRFRRPVICSTLSGLFWRPITVSSGPDASSFMSFLVTTAGPRER